MNPKQFSGLSACVFSIRPVCRQGRPPPEPEPHVPLRRPPAHTHTQLFVVSYFLRILAYVSLS